MRTPAGSRPRIAARGRAAAAGLAVLAALAAVAAGPAAAQTIRIPGLVAGPPLVDATDPWALADRMIAAGLPAEVEINADREPRIRSQLDGITFFLLFYGCTTEVDCRSVQFIAGFTMNTPPQLAVVNDWNAARIIGKAHLDEEGMPWINHLVTLEHGVTQDNFAAAIESWRIALRDFIAHIGFR
ncbi:MAG: YbjN domain-containing protein [Rhodobacteraceae bacterium]|jgi:hypothetical protein|nr:YbjN domain-containing protein [Paracoccaceae bacterium]